MLRHLKAFVFVPLACCALSATGAWAAAAQRTFVASTGNDANSCTITQPCRGFVAAVAKTSVPGEVVVLDSAGYGPVAISQSVTIVAPSGVYAGVSVFSGIGVSVNGAGIKVRLRGLQLDGLGGTTGVFFQQGAELVVEDSTITNIGDNGIDIRAPNSNTIVSGSVIRASTNSGIYADAIGGPVHLVVTHSRLEANNWGLYVRQGAAATLSESVVADNGTGIQVTLDNPGATAGSYASVGATTISNNTVGLSFFGGDTSIALDSGAQLTRVMLSGNGTAVEAVGNPRAVDEINFYQVQVDTDLHLDGSFLGL